MLFVETIAKIRRAHFIQGKSIKQICRELRVSRNTVRKVIRSGATEFSYDRSTRPRPKIDPWRSQLDDMLADNTRHPRRERLTLVRVYEELRNQGYDGSYDAVRRYAASWSKATRCQSRSKKGQCPGAKLDTWFDLGAHPGACAFQIADACQGALAAGQPFRSFGIFRITVWRFCSGATGSFRRSSRGYGRGGSGDREWRL